MKIYLNDWSLSSSKAVLANLDRIKAFKELLDKLKRICGIEVCAPRNLWDIPLSGLDLRTMSTHLPVDTFVPPETLQFLKSIYKDMHPETEGEPFFSEKEDMSNPSSSVGMAAKTKSRTLSFSFDGVYARDSIEGWIQTSEGKNHDRVDNVYEVRPEIYRDFVDLRQCEKINPKETPLWNVDMVSKVLDGIDFVNVNNKQRQSMLIHYGQLVAELNGWRYNPTISMLNRDSDHLRYVFDSEVWFTSSPVAYLSLDMEGPDLAFELCDKRGRHLGEYSWNGTHKQPKNNHGIKVKN